MLHVCSNKYVNLSLSLKSTVSFTGSVSSDVICLLNS